MLASDDEQKDVTQIVGAIVQHVQLGIDADWRLRCGHFIAALRLVQHYVLDDATGSISKEQAAVLTKHFGAIRTLLAATTSVGNPVDSARMFEAVDVLIRTWAQPKRWAGNAQPEGSLLHAGILTNMLETALSFYALALWDHSLTQKLTQDRSDVFRGLLDVSGVDADHLGDV